MLDRELAGLYGVETKRLKEAVKRNRERFAEDFMFTMTKEEFQNWRSQFATSKEDKRGLRYSPFCFTEQGVAMLSSVLNSRQAIAVNIQIIRVFTRMREMLLTHKDILLKLEQMEKKMMKQEENVAMHDKDIQRIFSYLKQLLSPPQKPRKQIGYKIKGSE